ncbi:MAG TPA: hypothetical protein VN520_02985 [Streptomyces sp.]|uniref:hypothetical protein n=1 Tax=Streptomyces sp. TaxID=1931 RepID=UPI002D0056F0|nr:hypothetical protein [Streptomyces sp.]HWU05362.1 hypothetical protein [Streptomyces sp.]
MPRSVRMAARMAAGVILLACALSACGGSGDSNVSGARDDLRIITKKTVTDTRPRMVEQCTTGTKKVKHTSTTKGKTRTWYTTEPTRTCKKVQQGTETYDRVVRRPRWCVELDDVDGNTRRDDVWYEVDSSTYTKAAAAAEGEKLAFTPLRNGC